MRRLYLVPLFLALSGQAAHACSMVKRAPGKPYPVPRDLMEGRVVDVREVDIHLRANATIKGQEATIEVVRVFHGPAQMGDHVVTTEPSTTGCGGMTKVSVGQRVLVARYQIEYALADVDALGGRTWSSPFALLADATADGLTGGESAALIERATADRKERCAAVGTPVYAQVTCGAGARDVRKVIYERIDDGWVEIARAGAPAQAEASPDAASAGSTK